MPITVHTIIRPLKQEEFTAVSYDVMRHVFAIHDELGRFFDERIYKDALAARVPGIELEVPVDFSFRDFTKRYYLDVLVASGALFEFKTVEKIVPRHRAQCLHYLLATGLMHGKLVNVRPELVEHEFVNTTLTPADRLTFSVKDDCWDENLTGASHLRETLLDLLRDWGTGLDVVLYEEALTHFLGGETKVVQATAVTINGDTIGKQSLRYAAPGVAFKLTALEDAESAGHFEAHARRLIEHTALNALLWLNVNRRSVTFTTLLRERPK